MPSLCTSASIRSAATRKAVEEVEKATIAEDKGRGWRQIRPLLLHFTLLLLLGSDSASQKTNPIRPATAACCSFSDEQTRKISASAPRAERCKPAGQPHAIEATEVNNGAVPTLTRSAWGCFFTNLRHPFVKSFRRVNQ